MHVCLDTAGGGATGYNYACVFGYCGLQTTAIHSFH